jgi:hypothetical protein
MVMLQGKIGIEHAIVVQRDRGRVLSRDIPQPLTKEKSTIECTQKTTYPRKRPTAFSGECGDAKLGLRQQIECKYAPFRTG